MIQKKGPGHPDESIMANATVKMNIRTSTTMLHTIRGVRLPLHISNKSKKKIIRGHYINYKHTQRPEI